MSPGQVERTPGRAALTYWVVGPLHSYRQEGWVDNNNKEMQTDMVVFMELWDLVQENAKGERILEFGVAVDMVVCNTFFKKTLK